MHNTDNPIHAGTGQNVHLSLVFLEYLFGIFLRSEILPVLLFIYLELEFQKYVLEKEHEPS